MQEITADKKWLLKAKGITEFVINNFSEADTGFFFYTSSSQKDVIFRKKEVYDGAVPSGNSTMAYNLYQLSILFTKPEWKKRSLDMISSLGKAITRYPTSFGNWANLLQEIITGTNEITVIGNNISGILTELLGEFIPHRVIMVADTSDPTFPLLAEKSVIGNPTIYLCRNNTCQHPVFSVEELTALINKAPDS